jgi:hypothetical protein
MNASYQLIILAALLVAGTANVVAKDGDQVQLAGCPEPGVESGCLILKDKGKTYNITAAPAQIDPADPKAPATKPKSGYLGIALSGVESANPSTCMQGTIVANIKWSYTRQRCEPTPSTPK